MTKKASKYRFSTKSSLKRITERCLFIILWSQSLVYNSWILYEMALDVVLLSSSAEKGERKKKKFQHCFVKVFSRVLWIKRLDTLKLLLYLFFWSMVKENKGFYFFKILFGVLYIIYMYESLLFVDSYSNDN